MGRDLTCKTCGEWMEGDGFTVALHCPNAEADLAEPDADPINCASVEQPQPELIRLTKKELRMDAVQRPRGPLGHAPQYAHLGWPSDVKPEQIEAWRATYEREQAVQASEGTTIQIIMEGNTTNYINVDVKLGMKPRFVPKVGEAYYVPCLPPQTASLDLDTAYLCNDWTGSGSDLAYLMWGMVFETSEEAVNAVKQSIYQVFGGDVDLPFQE